MLSCESAGQETSNTNGAGNESEKINSVTMKTIIVDVRTKEEWEYDGHADCSVNFPLDQLQSHIAELKNYDSVILVCRSGNRAAHAQSMLQKAGIRNVENKGTWQNIDCK